jgi:predicted permease
LYSSTKEEEEAARRRKFDWAISFFMLATLPNTVIVGIPLLQPMYGKIAIQGSICIISAQFLFWYNVCIVLFEVRAAQLQITADMQLMIKANNNKKELLLAQRQKMHIMSAAARGGGAAVASHAVVSPDEEENDLEEAHVDHDTTFRSFDIVVETVSNRNLLAAQDHELLKRHENIMSFSRGNNNSCGTTTSDAAGNSCSSPSESEIEAAGAAAAAAAATAAAFATKAEELDQVPGLLANKKEMVVHDLSCKQDLISITMMQQVQQVQHEAKVEAADAHHTAGGGCTESSSTFTIRHDHEQFESSTIYKLEEIQQVKRETSPEQQLERFSMLQQVCKRVLFRLLRLPILYGSVLGFTYSLLASR